MPLTGFQTALARLLSENRTFAAEPIDLHDLKCAWLAALDSVESFVASRPAEELGCLYYSAAMHAFADPRHAADAAPHFGRPGGVLPRIAES